MAISASVLRFRLVAFAGSGLLGASAGGRTVRPRRPRTPSAVDGAFRAADTRTLIQESACGEQLMMVILFRFFLGKSKLVSSLVCFPFHIRFHLVSLSVSCVSFCVPVRSAHLSGWHYLSICLPVFLSICLSGWLYVRLYFCPSLSLSV